MSPPKSEVEALWNEIEKNATDKCVILTTSKSHKAYVCGIHTGEYESSSWAPIKVFLTENGAKNWINKVNELNNPNYRSPYYKEMSEEERKLRQKHKELYNSYWNEKEQGWVWGGNHPKTMELMKEREGVGHRIGLMEEERLKEHREYKKNTLSKLLTPVVGSDSDNSGIDYTGAYSGDYSIRYVEVELIPE